MAETVPLEKEYMSENDWCCQTCKETNCEACRYEAALDRGVKGLA